MYPPPAEREADQLLLQKPIRHIIYCTTRQNTVLSPSHSCRNRQIHIIRPRSSQRRESSSRFACQISQSSSRPPHCRVPDITRSSTPEAIHRIIHLLADVSPPHLLLQKELGPSCDPPQHRTLEIHYKRNQSITWSTTAEFRTSQDPLLQTSPTRHPPPAPDTSRSTAPEISPTRHPPPCRHVTTSSSAPEISQSSR